MKMIAAAVMSLTPSASALAQTGATGTASASSTAGNADGNPRRPGDVIWTPPGVKHWHGAAPATAVTHIAIQESADGKNVEWMEKVSDEQYGK